MDVDALLDQGHALADEGDVDGAERAYREAAAARPDWSVPHYDLGLLYKYEGRWPESLAENQIAARLAPDDQASWWNLGIAATALGDWAEARRAWTGAGLQIPPGEGPIEAGYGPSPVRLDPDDVGEVVWGYRMDPARVRLFSVPLPFTSHNHGDVVLTDGAPVGYRMLHGRKLPVFDVLALLEPSPLRKFVVELATSHPECISALEHLAETMGAAAEDWGTSTNILCAECSRGTPHEHDRSDETNRPAHPHLGIAARDADHADEVLRAWMESDARADVVRWYEATVERR